MIERRPRPPGRRIFSEEQALEIIRRYNEGITQTQLCQDAEGMIGKQVSISTIQNLLSGRTYKGLASLRD